MTLRRILRWKPVEGIGLEHLHVSERDDGIKVRSVLIGEKDGKTFGVHYEMSLDPDWTFRQVSLQRMDGVVKILTSDRKGNWTDEHDQALPELKGCVDIEILYGINFRLDVRLGPKRTL